MIGTENNIGNVRTTPALDTPPPNSPKKREKLEELISQYGWTDKDLLNEELLKTDGYCDFLDFLYHSKLIYSIRGYETSLKDSDSELKHGIHIIDGEPCLFIDGEWTHWREIIDGLEYDVSRREITSKDDNDSEEWNYMYPAGLTQQTRYNWVGRVHQLNPDELGRLYQHSLKFFQNGEAAPPQENCHYIQIFTAGQNRLDQCGHVGLRLINEEGEVYSFGFETPGNEARISLGGLFSVLATYNVTIASLDFKEFQKFDIRRITTIPITGEAFAQTLRKIHEYANTHLRFNMLHQNCATFVADVLKTAGIPLDIRTTSFSTGLYSLAMPMIEAIPGVGFLVKKISGAIAWIFNFLATYTPSPICFAVKVITYLPGVLLSVIKNLAFIAFGAAKMGTKPPEDAENEVDNSERLTAFDRVYGNCTDVFKDVLNISLPFKVSDWQDEQASTEMRTFDGPQFYILPLETPQP